jgi:hypothetical protein
VPDVAGHVFTMMDMADGLLFAYSDPGSVPVAAWYADEHIPMLLAVPGWRRVRRFRLIAGTAPAYLALHELTSVAAVEEPAFRAAVTTPWRNRIVESAIAREQRVFGFHHMFG